MSDTPSADTPSAHTPSAARARATIRTAVIGYGLAGAVFHAPLIDAVDGLELTAVVTGNAEREAAARDRYPGLRVFGTADELWAVADSVDLVVVASPNSSHLPLALAALDADLPVVVDKPVAASVAEAERLRDAAAAAGLLLSVFQNRRWDGDLLTLQKLRADGALGDVHRFESRFERWRPQVATGAWRERPDPGEGGGLLLDLGAHLVDQALTLFGPVTSVFAEVRIVRPGALVDDDVFVALTHASGTVSHLWASAAAADLGPRLRVLGSRAAYVKSGLDVQEAALRAGGTPRDAGWGTEPEAAWGRVGTPGDTSVVPTLPGAYQNFYAGVRDALLTGGEPPVSVDEAIEALTVIEAARLSSAERRVVSL
ncbi:MAG: scyllo-inositol 2-dehydrogenase [Frankiaceae bacterium]|nr:scyllo-inositol 2-dehydrogenase [Frankiaceae bacterium]MDQ1727254.1 scyllo-inositol 2-dehydrogenase [Frankiaceae bacterium]